MQETQSLPAIWEVPQEFRRRLGQRAGRQRAMFADGHLLLVLHEPPEPDEDTRRGRFFWRKPDGSWFSTEQGSGLSSLETHLNEYSDELDRSEQIEQRATTAEDYFNALEQLLPVRRAAKNLHQVLQEARKLVPEDTDLINLRDRAYDISRTADLLYDAVKNGLDYAVAKRAEEQANSSHEMATAAHRLNLLAAFFFPIATLTAVFGMSLNSGLEKVSPPLPFFAVLATGIVLGVFLTTFVIKRR